MKSKYHAALYLELAYSKYLNFCCIVFGWLSKDQSHQDLLGHIAKCFKWHRGKETHTHKKKQESKDNAHCLSAFVSAAPSLAVTTLSDTHQG